MLVLPAWCSQKYVISVRFWQLKELLIEMGVVKHTLKSHYYLKTIWGIYSNALSFSTNLPIKAGEIIFYCNTYAHFLYYD